MPLFYKKFCFTNLNKYFRAMFSFDASDSYTVKLPEISDSVLEELILFIYTGYIKLTDNNVQELVTAADMMQVILLFTL